jgi:beta-lactam-binding protein with PASTA domain
MRAFFRLVLLALALVAVALVSALTAMRFAIHGREVAVPKLIGLSPTEADRAAFNSGVQVMIEREYYSPQIPEGRIMSQVPDPGAKVRRGWQVRVAQSLGPQRVAIPDLMGESGRAAEINIRRRGLDVGSMAEIPMPGNPGDQVIAQSPPANASGVSAPKISLLVSSTPETPSYVMPNFAGQSLGNATRALQDAGMKLGAVSLATAPPQPADAAGAAVPGQLAPNVSATPAQVTPVSTVISQSPPAGQRVLAGSTVAFEVK